MSRNDELEPQPESPTRTMLGNAVLMAFGCLVLIIVLVVIAMAVFVYVT